jgi:cyclopropane fatty-acyl-phospholipid synthase-like methyltransferase
MDLAGKEFWEGFWHRQDARRFAGLSHFQHRMARLLLRHVAPGKIVCEIGCGGSTWMPLLAQRGAEVWGIDYSDAGLTLAQRNLDRAGATATLVKADVRDPDALPRQRFDMIFSSGFIEHFDDAAGVLAGIAAALKPEGVIVTLVPNFVGPWGRLQRFVDPELFAKHTLYTPDALDAIHRDAGLAVCERAAFFGGFGPLVVNYTRPLGAAPPLARTAFVGAMWGGQQLVAWTLSAVGAGDARLYSSHVAGVYGANR